MDSYGLRSHFEELLVAVPAGSASAKKASSNGCLGGDRLRRRLYIQWDFQNPKMEVLSHMRPYAVGIIPNFDHFILVFPVQNNRK